MIYMDCSNVLLGEVDKDMVVQQYLGEESLFVFVKPNFTSCCHELKPGQEEELRDRDTVPRLPAITTNHAGFNLTVLPK